MYLFFTISIVVGGFYPRLTLQSRFVQCVGCDSCTLFPSAVHWEACEKKRSVFKLMFHIKANARCGANNIITQNSIEDGAILGSS